MRQYVACLSKSCKKVEGVIYRLQVAGQKLKCPRTVNAKVILRKKKLSFQCHAKLRLCVTYQIPMPWLSGTWKFPNLFFLPFVVIFKNEI